MPNRGPKSARFPRIWGRQAQKCPEIGAAESRKCPNSRYWGQPGPESAQSRPKTCPDSLNFGPPGPESAQISGLRGGTRPRKPSELSAFQAGPESLEFAAFGCFSGLVTSNAWNLAPAGSYSGEVCVCEGPKIRKKIGGNSSS